MHKTKEFTNLKNNQKKNVNIIWKRDAKDIDKSPEDIKNKPSAQAASTDPSN